MPKIEIDHNKCDGKECAECVDSCPMSIFKLENDGITAGSGSNVLYVNCARTYVLLQP
ncbi:MAG: hypothetical protein PWQ15_134 [Methanobacterium sp.]|nr:hypothetical protein [Methanobacterium sp.]